MAVYGGDGNFTASTSLAITQNIIPAWLSATSIATWNAGTQTLTVTGNTTIIADPGTFGVTPIINAGNASHLAVATPVANLGSLSLSGNATLDVQQNLVNLSNPTADPVSTIQGYVFGNQIISSSLTAGYAVGYGSVTVGNATETAFRYDAKGDTNLDGTVNDADLLTLLQNYGAGTTLWGNANFEYNPSTPTLNTTVNDADLLDVLHNYGAVVAGPIQAAHLTPASAGNEISQALLAAAPALAESTPVPKLLTNSVATTNDTAVLDDSPSNPLIGG